MKTRLAPLLLSAAILTACNRGPSPADLESERKRAEQLQQLDDRIAKLQDLERQNTERKLAETERRASDSEEAQQRTEKERQRLERERQELVKERDRLARDKQTAQQRADEAERQRQETAQQAQQERAERNIDLFYTALEPHGEWIDTDKYGFVWQPNAASTPGWRPYQDGRWVYTDYGWFWKSNEPFGWAAYHYGRWTRLRGVGWVWVPGTEWGPAWVAWRRGDRFVGWAPLPPEAWSGSGFNAAVDSYYDIGPGSYTFVAVEDLGGTTYVGRAVEPERNITIVKNTVNITNVTYTNVQNNTVVFNGGPELNEVNARSTQKIQKLDVQRSSDVRSPKELGRAEQKGNTLFVAAPFFSKARPGKPPVRVNEKLKQAPVERGWTEVQGADVQEIRERNKAEAHEAEQGRAPARAAAPRPAAVVNPPAATPKPQPPAEVRPMAPATPVPRPVAPAVPADVAPAATPKVKPNPAGVPVRPKATPIPPPAAADPVAQPFQRPENKAPKPGAMRPGAPKPAVPTEPAADTPTPPAGAGSSPGNAGIPVAATPPRKPGRVRPADPAEAPAAEMPVRPMRGEQTTVTPNVPAAPGSDSGATGEDAPNRRAPRALHPRPPADAVAPGEPVPGAPQAATPKPKGK